jgi:hypothetical protein
VQQLIFEPLAEAVFTVDCMIMSLIMPAKLARHLTASSIISSTISAAHWFGRLMRPDDMLIGLPRAYISKKRSTTATLAGRHLHHCGFVYHLLRHNALLAAEYFKLVFQRHMALSLQLADFISAILLPVSDVWSYGCAERSTGPYGRPDGAIESGFD